MHDRGHRIAKKRLTVNHQETFDEVHSMIQSQGCVYNKILYIQYTICYVGEEGCNRDRY